MQDSLVSLHEVSKSYDGSTAVVMAVNWDILPNKRLALLGSSGSGKSTLLALLGLLLRPSNGQVLIDGQDVWQWSERKRATWRMENLGYVWQDAGLLPELTILENVNLPLRIRKVPQKQWNGSELLHRVGLGNRMLSYPRELSGGEAQHVSIARALVGFPRLVIADEPTGNLQSQQGEDICRLFLDLQRDLGFALVVATHNEVLVENLQAEPNWIKDGRLTAIPQMEGK